MTNLQKHYEQQILTVTITRPQALNALNIAVLDELKITIDEFYTSEARAMIITGDGEKSFVAGADIKEFSSVDASNARAFSTRGQDIFNSIAQCPKPIIAAVNGFALGGGCELAMACHMRIATANAKFGLPEVTLGIIPGYGGTQRLAQLVGRGKALEIMLTANMVAADEARAVGLVNHVVANREEMLALSTTLLQKILANGPIAVANAIRSVNAGYGFENQGYETEAKLFAACVATDDFKEGSAAFVAKRKPEFKGK